VHPHAMLSEKNKGVSGFFVRAVGRESGAGLGEEGLKRIGEGICAAKGDVKGICSRRDHLKKPPSFDGLQMENPRNSLVPCARKQGSRIREGGGALLKQRQIRLRFSGRGMPAKFNAIQGSGSRGRVNVHEERGGKASR